MPKTFTRIKCDDIKEGVRFSAPVFFDDGTNMFLAEGKAAKAYHVMALKRWNVPFLLTYGHELSSAPSAYSKTTVENVDAVEELDSLEEVEPLEEL
jgi:hypothetical protein